jgi:RimJ/RimL family protein N-acetyltransferase
MQLLDAIANRPRPITFPARGLTHGELVFHMPTEDDIQTVAPAFLDEELAGAANMPPLREEELRQIVPRLPTLLEQGVFLPLLIGDAASGAVHGGANLHHFDWERGQCEIGYWLFERARGQGIATRAARFLADYAFSLGLERIEARVLVGNLASERVLERAGFRREGVLRSLPVRSGGRFDMTLFSLLPGE